MNCEVGEIIEALHAGANLPIDLTKIIESEGNIRLRPANYGSKFDDRIEYVPDRKIFILYHPASVSPRVRFSIAHELGHFYIPGHKRLLLAGKCHNSIVGYVSDKRLEREADEFAAHLLVPEAYLNTAIRRRTFLTLKDLLGMANELQVSATAMAIRYARATPEPCAVMLLRNGQQIFYVASDEMEYVGFQHRGRRDIPWNSASAEAAKNEGSGEVFEKEWDSDAWFSKRKAECKIWEEAFPLGHTGLVLTMLSNPSYNG